jgi:hypothetical protein
VKLFEEVQIDEEGNIKRDKLPEETIRLKVNAYIYIEITRTQRRSSQN